MPVITVSVRLSAEDKRNLDAIRKATGETASEAMREALKVRRAALAPRNRTKKTPYEVYREILAASDDDPPGTPTDDSTNVSKRVREILEAKYRDGRL
jgi:Glu-tRNA(Gln) amidotransferase subunit E-like FAD-binding protein